MQGFMPNLVRLVDLPLLAGHCDGHCQYFADSAVTLEALAKAKDGLWNKISRESNFILVSDQGLPTKDQLGGVPLFLETRLKMVFKCTLICALS